MRAARLNLPPMSSEEVGAAADLVERLADDLDAVAWNPDLMCKRYRDALW